MAEAAKIKNVETEALSLPEKDRADLARVLLLSLPASFFVPIEVPEAAAKAFAGAA